MLLLSFVFIYLIGSAVAVPSTPVPYFAGRSANIIIQPENAVNDNSAILLHGKQFESELKQIEDVHVADLFAHVMGTQPFNVLASREGFPKGDLFKKPKAALLITLDSIAPGLFGKYSTWKDYQRVDITTSTYPANTYTMTSNIATGTQPSTHGIVGEAWIMPNGERVSAHSTVEGASLAANMADILTQEWEGASLTVSASAYTPMAAAFAVSSQLAHPHSYGLSLVNGEFATIYAIPQRNPFAMDEQALQAIFKEPAFSTFLGAKVVVTDNKVVVTVGTTAVTFDLNNSGDFALFAELGFVYNFFNKLETDSSLSARVADSVPDFYSFAFSSLKDIKEIAMGILLVDNAIQQAVAKLDKLYDGRAVTAVACLDTQTIVSDQIKNIVYESAQQAVHSKDDFEIHFPSLYLRNGDSAQVCTKITDAVGTLAQVHCFASAYNWVMDDDRAPGPNSDPTPPPPLNVPLFWIFIFFPITFLGIILVGVIGLCGAGIEASKDSLLFRSAGRHH